MWPGRTPINPQIVHSALLDALDYDCWTGVFIRKIRLGPSMPGSRAGALMRNGYLIMTYKGHQILLHRLAWFYVYGEWPKGVIDHINGVRHDNRIANLRDVSQKINSQNNHRPKKNNASGVLGVHRIKRNLKNPWRAGISYDGKYQHIGYFSTPEEAHAAYKNTRDQFREVM